MEAVAKIREKRLTACLDLQQWHTTCIADILKPQTPWAFGAKSKKKCFSNALRHTLVVLEMHWAHRHFYLSIVQTKSGDNTF